MQTKNMDKIQKKIDELLLTQNPEQKEEFIRRLSEYFELRKLQEMASPQLPEGFRQDTDASEEFERRLGDFVHWDEMTEIFGGEPGEPPQWTLQEIQDLLERIKSIG